MRRRTADRLVDAWLRGERGAGDAVQAAQRFFRRKAYAAQRRGVEHVPGPDYEPDYEPDLAPGAEGAPWPAVVAAHADGVEFVLAPRRPLLEAALRTPPRHGSAGSAAAALAHQWFDEQLTLDGAPIPPVAGASLSPVAPPPPGE